MASLISALVAAFLAIVSEQIQPPAERVLDIAWHHQEHSLTCEAAALGMALSYFGINNDELTLLGYISVDREPARFDPTGHLIGWGDPDVSYVGNPDGNIDRYTGYGVYDQPVVRAAVMAGAHVVVSGSGLYDQGVEPSAVYAAVLRGQPVVTWISNTYRQVALRRYVAFDGRPGLVHAHREHAVTVVSVRSDAVLINDPWFGPAWHSKAQFESAYATFQQMAVVIRA